MRTETDPPATTRRRLLGRALCASPWLLLSGCAAPWPDLPTVHGADGSSSALQHLRSTAQSQGLAAWRGMQDLSLTLSDTYWPPAGLLRSGATAATAMPLELRLLPSAGSLALRHEPLEGGGRAPHQLHQAQPGGRVHAWSGGLPVADEAPGRGAAVVADLHRLLLLGAIALAEHPGPVHWAEPVTLDGRRCDHLHLLLQPGLGGGADRLSLFIDRDQGRLRRLRVSLTGLGLALDLPLEVNLSEHRRLHGLLWPGRWSATAPTVLPGRPPPSWVLLALDINRGYVAADLAQSPWAGRAATSPSPLPLPLPPLPPLPPLLPS